ncbi:hypothetical protein [uncultured Aquimarina sp.]|uniref:hypothetical protein n=1 Tax=uncultured Aquimarina sp. TaxID=575652 RepID=UPI0026063D33|nr:hypothetical protein [uncultured Aquimarina sp.]
MMFKEITNKANRLFKYYPELNTGKRASMSEYKNLKWNTRRKIPKWFRQLMIDFPLTDLNIGIPFNYGWESLKNKKINELPLLNTKFNSFDDMAFEATETFPGLELIKKGFICIAPDENSSGDGFYIKVKEKNPKVVYVYHDCGSNSKELISNSQLIAASFTEFLDIIKPPEIIDDWIARNSLKDADL